MYSSDDYSKATDPWSERKRPIHVLANDTLLELPIGFSAHPGIIYHGAPRPMDAPRIARFRFFGKRIGPLC